MANKIIPIVALILAMPMVLAMYPGETQTIDVSNEFISILNYTIEGNISQIDVYSTDLRLFIGVPKDATPQTFNITLTGMKDERPATIVYVSGGGSKSKIEKVPILFEFPKFIFVSKPVEKNLTDEPTVKNIPLIQSNPSNDSSQIEGLLKLVLAFLVIVTSYWVSKGIVLSAMWFTTKITNIFRQKKEVDHA